MSGDTKTLKVVIVGDATSGRKALSDLDASGEQTQGHFSKMSAAVAGAFGGIAAAGTLAMGGMAISAVKSGLQTAASMEQAQIAFSQLIGSGQQAKDFLGNLSKFAAATPFEMPGLVDAARGLLGVGVKANDVIPTLTAYGDAAGALGISQDGFNHIMLATNQAMSAGTLHAGDLLQMTEAGLPVWNLLSEALGLPVAKLKDMSAKGQLVSADVLPKLQAQMEKDYGGSMAKQSQTLNGLWSTLMDTFNQGMARVILPLEPMLRTLIPAAANFTVDALDAITSSVQFLVDGGKELYDKLAPNVESAFHTIEGAVKPAVEIVEGFFGVFSGQGSASLDNFSGGTMNRVINAAGAASSAFDTVKRDVETVVNFFTQTVGPAISKVWNDIQPSIRRFVTFIQTSIVPGIQSMVAKILPLLQKLAAIFQSAFTLVMIVVQKYVGLLMAMWDRFGAQFVGHIVTQLEIVWHWFQQIWNAIVLVLSGVFAIIQGILDVFIGIFTGKWSKAWQGVQLIFSGVWQIIQGVFSAVWATIVGLVRTGINEVSTVIGAVMATISLAWSKVWGAIKGVVSSIWGDIKGVVHDGVQWIEDRFGDVVSFAAGVPGQIAGFFSNVWHNIGEDLLGALNSLLHLPLKIPEFKIGAFGHYVTVGGQTLIPQLATGGVFDQATLAIVGEASSASNKEIVTPSDLMRSIVREEMAKAGAGHGLGPVSITQEFYGFSTEEAKRLAKEGTQEALAELGRKVRAA